MINSKGVPIQKPKVIVFTNIDIYPDKYSAKKTHDGFVFEIKSIVIEHIYQQQQNLVNISQQLILGDYVEVDTYFGHYPDKDCGEENPSKWISVPLKARLKVSGIYPLADEDQIRLIVKPHRFRIRLP